MHVYTNRTVIPSFLGTRTMGEVEPLGTFSSVGLLLGEVKEIIYKDDNKSLTKKYTEYAVDVQYRQGTDPITTVRYPNCYMANLFGGIADRFTYTLREDPKEPEGQNTITTGSKVLLLCINGNTQSAYIIGGVREGDKQDDKDDGHNLFFEFNGVQLVINKDGEPTFKFRGATQKDGKLTDNAVKDAEGTNVNVDKNGNLKIATPDDKQYIRLNHKDKKIEILADEEWSVEVNGKIAINAGKDIDVSSKQKVNVNADSNVNIKSEGVLVGDATDFWIKGTTYRNAEQSMNNDLKSNLQQLQTAFQIAGIALISASAMQKVPIAGAIAASVPLQMAAQQLQRAAPLFNAMSTAISTMESKSSDFLSKKNKAD